MTDIAIQVILTAEIQYHENALRKAETERAEKERQKHRAGPNKPAPQGMRQLFSKPREIRKYVEAI